MRKILTIFVLLSLSLTGFTQEEDYPAPEHNIEAQEGRSPDSENLNPEEAPTPIEQSEQEYREPSEPVENQEAPVDY